jgi:DNA polymerase II large subunit
MKKTILSLLVASIVTVSNSVATEEVATEEVATKVSEIETLRAMNSSLREQLEQTKLQAAIALSLEDEKISRLKEAIRNTIHEKNTVFSTFQQRLLPQRQQGKIGNNAWAVLGGTNHDLNTLLLDSILAHPGKTVEIFYLGTNNFKLRINGKEQHHPYKF